MQEKRKPDVLVLNRSFVPIHLICWQKCMSLLCQESARALDRDFVAYDFEDWLVFSETEDDYPIIATSSKKIALPEIIVLKHYDRLPQKDVKYSRQSILQRDKYICAFCGHVFKKEELTIDHIIPRCRGGKTTWDNTIAACKPCNLLKADRTPEQAKMPLKFKPKKPEWFGPLSHIKPDHPCKSWQKFMYRVSLND